jgi:hypothetical protein
MASSRSRKFVATASTRVRIALDDLALDALYVVYSGEHRYALAPRVQALPLASLLPASGAS